MFLPSSFPEDMGLDVYKRQDILRFRTRVFCYNDFWLLELFLFYAVDDNICLLYTSVAVNKDNFTCGLIQKAGRFAAVALDQRADLMTVGRFGFRTGWEEDKFAEIPFAEDKAGMPYPLEAACARFSCKVEQTVDLGTHILFVGLAERCV